MKNISARIPVSLEISPFDEDKMWKLLGYDVQDGGPTFAEGLAGGVYPNTIQERLKENWGPRLNKYHLFTNQDDAVEYAIWQEGADPGIARYFAYGLYFIQSLPATDSTDEA